MFLNVTLKTLIWQLAECRWSVYSPFSVCLKVSTWILKGTPFSPPCLRGVNSVLIQCTWKETKTKPKGPSEAFQAWTLLLLPTSHEQFLVKKIQQSYRRPLTRRVFHLRHIHLRVFSNMPNSFKSPETFWSVCNCFSCYIRMNTVFQSYKHPLRVSREKISAIEGTINNLTGQCSQFILLPYGILSEPVEQPNYSDIVSVPLSVRYHFF